MRTLFCQNAATPAPLSLSGVKTIQLSAKGCVLYSLLKNFSGVNTC